MNYKLNLSCLGYDTLLVEGDYQPYESGDSTTPPVESDATIESVIDLETGTELISELSMNDLDTVAHEFQHKCWIEMETTRYDARKYKRNDVSL